MARPPAVAGQFYEGTRQGLIREIEGCFVSKLGPGRLPEANPERQGRIRGLICPHAGYYYSGGAAAHAYEALAADGIPDVAVLLGPNHYGRGSAVAISPDDSWATPLGSLSADAEVAEAILNASKYTEVDELPHAKEHSIEVQLPFLQYIGGDRTRIVPISIRHIDQSGAIALAEDLGSAIAAAISGKSAVVIASTDLTHYEPQSVAEATDALVLEKILDMDPEGLIRTVYAKNITMCGAIGVAVMLAACKKLGADKARKLAYYTSGDVSGDTSTVVGYGAVSLEK